MSAPNFTDYLSLYGDFVAMLSGQTESVVSKFEERRKHGTGHSGADIENPRG